MVSLHLRFTPEGSSSSPKYPQAIPEDIFLNLPRAPPGSHQPLCGGDRHFLTQNVTPPPPSPTPPAPLHKPSPYCPRSGRAGKNAEGGARLPAA